mmetsp:Transcript_6265/g.15876  ORF Transcript_6265/g.15876 Transcript_6265/m.15876 type:complete len:90 (-) Transcript_6265:745-1014(-)
MNRRQRNHLVMREKAMLTTLKSSECLGASCIFGSIGHYCHAGVRSRPDRRPCHSISSAEKENKAFAKGSETSRDEESEDSLRNKQGLTN